MEGPYTACMQLNAQAKLAEFKTEPTYPCLVSPLWTYDTDPGQPRDCMSLALPPWAIAACGDGGVQQANSRSLSSDVVSLLYYDVTSVLQNLLLY